LSCPDISSAHDTPAPHPPRLQLPENASILLFLPFYFSLEFESQ